MNISESRRCSSSLPKKQRKDEAYKNLVEEYTDVETCARELCLRADPEIEAAKRQRFYDRISMPRTERQASNSKKEERKMTIKLPLTENGEYIDTEETSVADIRRQADKSFRNFTSETNRDYCFEDVLKYIDCLNKYVHKRNFNELYRGLLYSDLDWHIDNGDIPGEVEFEIDEDFCNRIYDDTIELCKLGGHSYINTPPQSHEEMHIKFVLVTIIKQVIETYGELTKDLVADRREET